MPKIEPLNSNYDEEKVVEAISVALSEFYTSLTNKLNKIKLKDILKKKNPYLYRAKGINDATMVINRILSAYISSSEETIFGNTFFEPIAIVVSGGQKAVTEGVDITVDKDNTIYSIAVKSGTSVFNADSRKRQEQNFQSAQKRAQQAHKAFMPVVGYGYGKKKVKPENEKFYKEAFEVFAYNYLVKPVESGELEHVLVHILEVCRREGGRALYFRYRKQVYTLQHDHLAYISSSLHSVTFHLTDGKKISCRARLGDFSGQLSDSSFLRCHQSFCINMEKVTSLKKNSFVVGQAEIPISRTYLKTARKKYKDYLAEQKVCS